MQITIRFDKAMGRDMSIFNAILKLVTSYTDDIYRIGMDMGINASHISWDDAYQIAGSAIRVIELRGSETVEGIKIQIGPDVDETVFPLQHN